MHQLNFYNISHCSPNLSRHRCVRCGNRLTPLCAFGSALTCLGLTPMERMNQTALVEGMNDGRTTSMETEYFAEVTDLYYLLIYPWSILSDSRRPVFAIEPFQNHCLRATDTHKEGAGKILSWVLKHCRESLVSNYALAYQSYSCLKSFFETRGK